MREDLKRELDESVPEDVTLSETKKREIMKAAQEKDGGWKPSRVPKLLPALAGVVVIGASGIFAYPFLFEENGESTEVIQQADENEQPSIENEKDPESPVKSNEETTEEMPVENEEEPVEEEATEEPIKEEQAEEPIKEEQAEEPQKEAEDTGNQLLSKEEKFIQLLDHSYFDTDISLGDAVAEVEKNYPNWIEKSDYEGGVTILYEDFILIHGYFETIVNTVILQGFEQLTVKEIEKVIEEDIEVTTSFNAINYKDESSGEFFLDGQGYTVIADSSEENARVLEIIIALNHRK